MDAVKPELFEIRLFSIFQTYLKDDNGRTEDQTKGLVKLCG